VKRGLKNIERGQGLTRKTLTEDDKKNDVARDGEQGKGAAARLDSSAAQGKGAPYGLAKSRLKMDACTARGPQGGTRYASAVDEIAAARITRRTYYSLRR
jgi:hypothetical protein